jgi:anti-sigma B factor antagonist
MKMDVTRVGDSLRIHAKEDITATGVDALRKAVLNELKEGISEVCLDLADVEMIDSTGISLLISIQNSLSSKGGRLKLDNTSDDITQMFKLMRLDRHFKVNPREG